jgi:dTDP-4-amino-4,6-dideoxygalactose transaminase
MNKVPFLDLKAGYLELREEIHDAIYKSLNRGWYIGGEDVDRFEDDFSKYVGTDHCMGVANGLDALRLALTAMEVGVGDEVIVPSHTFIATWLAVSHTGATFIPVEPEESTFNIDPSKIEAAITPRTKIIIPVHLYGQPADLDPILEIGKKYGILILEDAAQAHGAKYKGRRIGSDGDAVAWSFYPGKNLGALGDGGAITTNSRFLAEKIRKLRNYGSSKKYHNEVIGYNSRLDPLQAAVLSVKLRYLDEWNNRRKEIAQTYLKSLSNSQYIMPTLAGGDEHSWHLFVIRSSERDLLQKKLRESGVETLIHYPTPPHLQQAYSNQVWQKGSLPLAEKIADEILSLPIGPHQTFSQTEQVIKALRS